MQQSPEVARVDRFLEMLLARQAEPEPTVTLAELAAEVPPCQGRPSVDACRRGQACRAFLYFVRGGKANASAKRVPSERLYANLFREDLSGTAEAELVSM